MPRKRYGKRKTYRRRPYVRRRNRRLTYINRVVRKVQLSDISSNIVAVQNVAYSFKLSDLPNYTEFTALYDQYKIEKVHLKFMTMANSNTLSNACAGSNGVVAYVYDFDDNTALTTLNDYLQYGNCKVTTGLKNISATLRPHIASAVYGAGAFTSYSNVKNRWLDVASPSVDHYGFKIQIPATTNSSTSIVYKVIATYTVSFKNTR